MCASTYRHTEKKAKLYTLSVIYKNRRTAFRFVRLAVRLFPAGGIPLWLLGTLLAGRFQSVPDGGAFQISGVSGYRKGTGAVAHDKETRLPGCY